MSLSKPLREFSIESEENYEATMAGEIPEIVNRSMAEVDERERKFAPIINRTDMKARLRMPGRRLSQKSMWKSVDPPCERQFAPECVHRNWLEKGLLGRTKSIFKIEGGTNQGRKISCINSLLNIPVNASSRSLIQNQITSSRLQRDLERTETFEWHPSTKMPFEFQFKSEEPSSETTATVSRAKSTAKVTQSSRRSPSKSVFLKFKENFTKPRTSYENLWRQTPFVRTTADECELSKSSSSVFEFGSSEIPLETSPNVHDKSDSLKFTISSSEGEHFSQSENNICGEANVSSRNANENLTHQEYDPSKPLESISSSDNVYLQLKEDIYEQYDPSEPLVCTSSCSDNESFQECQISFSDLGSSESNEIKGRNAITTSTSSKNVETFPNTWSKTLPKRTDEGAWEIIRRQYYRTMKTNRNGTMKANKEKYNSGSLPQDKELESAQSTVPSQQKSSSGRPLNRNRFNIKEIPMESGSSNDWMNPNEEFSTPAKQIKKCCCKERNSYRGKVNNLDQDYDFEFKTHTSVNINPLQRSKKTFFTKLEEESVEEAPPKADRQTAIAAENEEISIEEDYNSMDSGVPYATLVEHLEEQIWSMRLGTLTECHREILMNIERMLLRKREALGIPDAVDVNELLTSCSNFEELAELAEKEAAEEDSTNKNI